MLCRYARYTLLHLMMVYVNTETLCWKYIPKMNGTSIDLSRWLSKVILRTSTATNLHLYRILERTSLKLISARSHLLFNETCYNIYIRIS